MEYHWKGINGKGMSYTESVLHPNTLQALEANSEIRVFTGKSLVTNSKVLTGDRPEGVCILSKLKGAI